MYVHTYTRFQVEEDEAGDDTVDSAVAAAGGGGARFPRGGSGDYSRRDVQPRKLRKRARAWKVFVAVMQDHGLRVRKYHRHGKGWAHRVVKYDPALPGLRWKTSKWWDSSGGQVGAGKFLVVGPRPVLVLLVQLGR